MVAVGQCLVVGAELFVAMSDERVTERVIRCGGGDDVGVVAAKAVSDLIAGTAVRRDVSSGIGGGQQSRGEGLLVLEYGVGHGDDFTGDRGQLGDRLLEGRCSLNRVDMVEALQGLTQESDLAEK
jgi:hypothetical protein